MQIRGGRGYETETSLAARGEEPIGVERMMRDYRINKIFEGSSEIMHLFMAREAVDKHLQVAGAMIDPEKSVAEKLAELPKMTALLRLLVSDPVAGLGAVAALSRSSGSWRRTCVSASGTPGGCRARSSTACSSTRASCSTSRRFLFRLVDIANELFAMAASVSRAHGMAEAGHPEAANAAELADLFCRNSRRLVVRLFRELWANDDVRKYKVAAQGARRQARLGGGGHPQPG